MATGTSVMHRAIIISIALIVIAIVLPIGLAYIGSADSTTVTLPNGSSVALSDAVDPAIITLLTILLPILVVIAIILYFIPRSSGRD